MGCIKSKVNWPHFNCFWNRSTSRHGIMTDQICYVVEDEQTPTKQYSWDLRPKSRSHRIENKANEEIIFDSGSINGAQVSIDNCRSCRIYLFDYSSAINIDDCEDCIIISGPVKGSLFLRDTSNSTLSSVSGQLRLRDCKEIHIFGGSESEPIIETSTNICIGPYTLNYDNIAEHFKQAFLYPDKLITNTMYDFTPPSNSEDSLNWKATSGSNASKYLPAPSGNGVIKGFSTNELSSYVKQYAEKIKSF